MIFWIIHRRMPKPSTHKVCAEEQTSEQPIEETIVDFHGQQTNRLEIVLG